MNPVLVFDIETVPDVAGLRTLYELGAEISDKDVAAAAFQRRRQSAGNDFLQLHLHRVVAIACVLRERDSVRVWSLGEADDGEGALIQRFFDGIEKYTPQIVSWNGGGFDLPVLHYRGMMHGVSAPRYWDQGEDDREFKWNNYISRYHSRHLDLMDLLAMYQPRGAAPRRTAPLTPSPFRSPSRKAPHATLRRVSPRGAATTHGRLRVTRSRRARETCRSQSRPRDY